MANSKQALKRARQATSHRTTKRWQLSRANSQIKAVLAAIEAKSIEESKKAYQLMTSMLDKLSSKGFIHSNKASRHKSRVAARIAALEKAA